MPSRDLRPDTMSDSPQTPSASDSRLHAVILAGGSGQRFWPLSRDKRPKQLIPLLPEGPLLSQTVKRLEGLVPISRILILTNAAQIEAIRELLPELPAANVLAEPERRDTGAAVALAAAWVAALDTQATMVMLPADHYIPDTAAFQKVIRAAVRAAESSGDLVTLGVKPTWPCPGYGYIERGEPVAQSGGEGVFHVTSFREKPDPKLAEWFLQQGRFVWNAGIFIWTIAALRRELGQHNPALAEFLDRLASEPGCPPSPETILRAGFGDLPQISIDYALVEKSRRVLNLAADFEWDDVGSWHSAARHLPADDSGNRCNRRIFTLDAASNVVFSDSVQQVALVGVHDLIVVQTADALLVADSSRAEDIKHLVTKLPPELR